MLLFMCLTMVLSSSVCSFADSQYNISKTPDVIARLGGGPSPSAAWEVYAEGPATLNKSQIESLEVYYQKAINSTRYKAGKLAYTASLFLAGCAGVRSIIKSGSTEITVGGLSGAVVGTFGKTEFSTIQDAANTASLMSAEMSEGEEKEVYITVYYRIYYVYLCMYHYRLHN